MIKIIYRYLSTNKKTTFITLLGITLSCMLLISIGLIFSSFHHYLVYKASKDNDYHVIIKGDLGKYKDKNIASIKLKKDKYYIKFKNIRNTYDNVKYICKYKKCQNSAYNETLLSLYGVGKKNIFSSLKNILITLVTLISISSFFIIYNTFKLNLKRKQKYICLYKMNGASNLYLYKLFFLEGIITSVLGIILGLITSFIFCHQLIKGANSLLPEIFNNKLSLNIYFEFIIIPLIFIFLIIIISVTLPLKDITKYKAMQLLQKNEPSFNKIKFKQRKSFNTFLAKLNYERNKKQYTGVIICIFISILLFNSFSQVLSYGLKSIKEYVKIPNYDLSLVSEESEINKAIKDLKPFRKTVFKYCEIKTHIPKEYYLKNYKENINVIITDLGGNKIINVVDEISNKAIISHEKYNRFKNLDKLIFDDFSLENLSLTNQVGFGLDTFLTSTNVVVTASPENFAKACPNYNVFAALNTNYKGLSNYLESFKGIYINTVKAKEIIKNITLAIKTFLYLIVILINVISFVLILNVMYASINLRMKDLIRLKSLGMQTKDIILSLLYESFYLSFKSFFYSVPFIFLFNKLLYEALREVIKFSGIIINYKTLFLSFFLSFAICFLTIIFMHKKIAARSIISNVIKDSV